MAERKNGKSRLSRRLLSWLLALAMIVTAMSWTGMDAVTAWADEDDGVITVGNGTLAASTTPYYASYKNATVELLYTAENIKNAGGSAGEISAIAFEVVVDNSLTTESLEIYMAQSKDVTAITATLYTDGLVKVYTGNPTLGEKAGWETILLDTPFEWDGESNIIIAVCRKSTEYKTGLTYRYATNSGKAAYRGNDSDTKYAEITSTTTMSTTNYLPNIQFTIETCKHENKEKKDTIAATCTEEGYEFWHCNDCGKDIKLNKTPALGHDYKTETTKEATCTEDGSERTTCTRCDYEDITTIPALGHDWDWDNPITVDENDNATARCKHDGCTETMTKNLKVSTWDGEWPAANSTAAFSGGTGTAEDPYLISTAEDLAQLEVNVSNASIRSYYNSKYYKQTINIDLANASWKPIGISNTYAFEGNYDGGGFSIDNIKLTGSTNYLALFGYIASTGKVHDLSVSGENTSTSTSYYTGGIAAYNAGTIENCVNYINLKNVVSGAGIAGYSSGAIANCENYGNITIDKSTHAGGIVAYLGTANIKNCSNYGDVENNYTSTGVVDAGGIVGTGYGTNATVKNCYNYGSVKAVSSAAANHSSSLASAGGIVGYCTNPNPFTIENCYNAGLLTAEYPNDDTDSYALCGQILGNAYSAYDRNIAITSCYWNAADGVAYNDTAPYSQENKESVTATNTEYVSDNTALLEKLNAWVTDNNGEDNLYLSWAAGEGGLPVFEHLAPEPCGHDTMIHHVANPATCTEAGSIEYWECSDCGKLFCDAKGETEITEEEIETEAIGHDVTLHEGVAATCTVAGSIEHWECNNCHKLYNDQAGTKEIGQEEIEIQAIGHTMTHHEAVAATCTEAGSIEYWECSECSKLFRDEAGTNEIEQKDLVIPAGHVLTHYEAVAATCTEAGSNEYWECSECSKLFRDEVGINEIGQEAIKIPAKGHDITLHDEVAATCTEAGSIEHWECDNCHKLYYDEAGTSEIEQKAIEIPAKGHELTHYEAVAATCTEAGSIEYWECSTCHKKYSDADGTEEITNVVIPAGHDLMHHEAVAATCTEAGSIEYWECSECSKLFRDEAGTNEIGRQDIEIAATGHKETEVKNAKAATCTEKGYTGDTYCKECGAKLEEGKEIPAVGHQWGEAQVTKEPTDTQTGIATRTCSVCGEKEQSVIPKLQKKITIKKGATYTVGGMKYKVTNASTNGKGTVTLCGTTTKKTKLKTLTVKATVKIEGKSFKVTAVGAKAFKGYKNLKTVSIGKNVTSIGAEAFSACKSLKKMNITSTALKKVGKKAISNINKKAAIKVPAKKRAAYKKLFKAKTGYKKTMKIK